MALLMTNSKTVTLRVDLNRLKGNRLTTSRRFVAGSALVPSLHEGQWIRVIEEEGDTYDAQVERVVGDRVHLALDLRSLNVVRISTSNPVIQSGQVASGVI